MLRVKNALIALVILSACQESEFTPPQSVNNQTTNNTNNNVVPPGVTFGAACDESNICRAGLVCAEGICGAEGNVEIGQLCELTAQCVAGSYCDAVTTACVGAGTTPAGGECGLGSECEAGLICAPQGFSGVCTTTGVLDVGAPCETTSECLAGLGCGVSPLQPDSAPICLAGPAGLPRPWEGADCVVDDGPFRAYFEVPETDALADFYRHPYPSDARLKNGHPVLSGHPTPGNGVLDFDLVQRYLDAISASQDRFSPNSAVFLRFSKTPNFDSLNANGDSKPVQLIDIDPASPNYGRAQAFGWNGSSGRNRYICPNNLVVRPSVGRPLAPNTTYAVLLSNVIKDDAGTAIARDADFEAMLGSTRPTGAKGEAWDAYAALRTYFADAAATPVAEATISFAAVFTTGNPIEKMRVLVDDAKGEMPVASELTQCDTGVVSPCDDGLTDNAHVRGCFAASTVFDEIQGKMSLPIYQAGTAPYLETGGAATPGAKRSEDVCFAMTVPADTAPAEGWPVLLVAHGTGGNYRGHVDQVSELFTTIDVDGTPVKFVTIGWDQVQHFNRRGDSEAHPNGLVYNYANPDAALGNFLQGGAEIASIVSWIASDPITAALSPTGVAVPLDPNQIWFLGHSQGGTTGPLALPFESRVRGAILSGAGASLVNALVGKTSPVNSLGALKIVLQDPSVGVNHPVIQLLQGYFDPVDPVNFARRMTAAPIDGVTTSKHIFQTHGVTDTFTPPSALDTLAIALLATYIEPMIDPISGVPTSPGPVSGNVTVAQVPFTVVGRQYQPDGYDGHFVLFRDAGARQDAAEFLGSGVVTGVPEVR
jgi:hypothetical protein